MQLSQNFTLAEFVRSETADRFRLDNTQVITEHLDNLKALCTQVLQPLRDAIGSPLRINSGFRSAEVNDRLGGARGSQHLYGEAADIECLAVDNLQLAHRIVELGLPFDQLILEFYKHPDPRSGWVHVSHSRKINRGQVLTAARANGKNYFVKGLPPK